MKSFKIPFFAFLLFSATVNAQNEYDALRYSILKPSGTARYVSMGGAFGALGGDFSVLSSNPAGLGIYRKSEITLSPSLFYSNTDALYYGKLANDDKYNFNFGNMGFVFAFPSPQNSSSEWKGVNIGFGFNRLNNFHNRYLINSYNPSSTLTDVFLYNAAGSKPSNLNPFAEGIAFDTYVLDTLNGKYISPVSYTGFNGVQQKQYVENKGAMGETVISLAGNYQDKFYIGGTIGITRVRYTTNSTYSEDDTKNYNPNFNYFDYKTSSKIIGTGYNVKFGAIYRATDFLRLGASIHTPTFFSLSEEYTAKMNSSVYGSTYASNEQVGNFDYRIQTPLRAIGSIGVIINKNAILSAEYEHVDYSTAKLRATGETFLTENTAIKTNFKRAGNIKLGGEVRFDPFTLRAGFNTNGSPLNQNTGINFTQNTLAFGLGYRTDDFFLDFGYSLTTINEDYYLYSPSIIKSFVGQTLEPSKIKTKLNNFVLTAGVRF